MARVNPTGRAPLLGEGVRAALFFAAATVVLTYPLSLHPATTVIYQGADTLLLLWLMAWDGHALAHAPLSIFDANIFYPFRHTLAYAENLIGSAAITAPFPWIRDNPVLALNTAVLLALILSGVGAYILARRCGASPAGAALAGFIFAYAPPHFFRIGQLHLLAIQWVPFCLASMHAYFEWGRKQDLWWACAFFYLQTLTSGHGAVYAAVGVAAFAAWRFALGEPLMPRKRLRDLGVPGVTLLALSAALYIPYRAAQQEVGLRRSLREAYMYAPSLVSFLASSTRLHTYLFSRLSPPVLQDATAILFPGFLPLALGMGGIWVVIATRRSPADGRTRRTAWSIAAGLLDLMLVVSV